MNIKSWTLTETEMTAHANKVKDVFIDTILSAGVISEALAADLYKHSILIITPTALGRYMRQLVNGEDKHRIIVCKMIEEAEEDPIEDAEFLKSQKEMHEEIIELKAEISRLTTELAATTKPVRILNKSHDHS